jgi:hypothetical protein
MPSPYTVAHDPADKTTNGSMEMSLGGKQIKATLQIASVSKSGTQVGYVEVISFGGLHITDAMFKGGAKGSASTTNGKISWSKINGITVALLDAPKIHGVEYLRDELMIAVLAETSRTAKEIAIALMSVTGGSSGNPIDLASGRHSTAWLKPGISYVVPAGWSATDTVNRLGLTNGIGDGGVFVFSSPQALSQGVDCPTAAEPGVGHTAADLVQWIKGLPGLTVSTPKQVSIGRRQATELELRVASKWTSTCPFSNGLHAVPLFYDATAELGWWMAGDEILRLDILDAPGGGTVVIDIDSFDGTSYPGLLSVGDTITKSITFTK